jgi:aryl-alcohol dehydrogenase-like predicted oxidoreductase
MSYGTSSWQPWVLDEDRALPLLEHAYKSGINTWDTADVYSHGRSEEIIGKALKQYNIPRHRVVIMTKCFYGVADEADGGSMPMIAACSRNDGLMTNRVGLSRKHIFDAVERSVKRLGTYIDVLQIHRLDRETPREEIMRALNDVVESGMVRYIGASTVCCPHLYPSMHQVQLRESAKLTLYAFVVYNRWQPGNSNPSTTSPHARAGTPSSPCKTITTCSPAKKSGR